MADERKINTGTDLEAVRAEIARTNAEWNPRGVARQANRMPCPNCKTAGWKSVVKKEGPNTGRPFFSCADCDHFEWLDLPLCVSCEHRLADGTKKDGKHKGRKFRWCPHCKGTFTWLD